MPTVKKAPTSKDVGSLYDIKGRHYYTDDRSVAGLRSKI